MFNNKNVLITGGTGSFGSAFVKRILNKYNPRKIIVFSRDEYKQSIMKEDPFFAKRKNIRFFIGDVRDRDRLNLAFSGVDFVVHAAAMKQIPATENDPLECIKTNVYGAENIIQAALNNKIKKVIALSTDKAVNPINLYGASKLASDKLFVSANLFSGKMGTKFSVVRYGNVAGSRGSVLPFFQKLISNKNKFLPITDPKMTRFWLTLEQGVLFVENSFKRMMGGEIFIPIIPSLKIIDLAKAISSSARLKIIGKRPGEKIHESLFSKEESHLVSKFKDYYVLLSQILHEKQLNNFKNNLGEKGKILKNEFEYNSGDNTDFLNIKQIKQLNIKLKNYN
jgi:UDP-N-acetylglucosamine 4,6-dehydratase